MKNRPVGADGGRQTDMMKLIVAFRNFAKAPIMYCCTFDVSYLKSLSVCLCVAKRLCFKHFCTLKQ